jgi:hypothetical protein
MFAVKDNKFPSKIMQKDDGKDATSSRMTKMN